MRYVQSVLMPNEELITTAKTHWFIYITPMLWLIITLIAYGFLRALISNAAIRNSALWLLMFFIPLTYFLKAWLYAYSTELAVTSKRVIAKFGFIKRNTIELKHSKIESLQVKQTILGRIFNYGSIIIIGSGGTSAPIPYIRNPLHFRSAALTSEEE